MRKSLRAYSKLALGKITAGSTIVVGKVAVASLPVFLISGLRLGIALILLVLLLLKLEKGIPSIGRRDAATIFLQAFAGVFLFSTFLLYGLKMTTAVESGVIVSMTPVAAGIISFLFLKERLTWNRGAGIMLSVVGLLVVNTAAGAAGEGRGANHLFGNMLVSGAVIGEALFTIFGKIESEKVSPLTVATLVSAFGFFVIPAAINLRCYLR